MRRNYLEHVGSILSGGITSGDLANVVVNSGNISSGQVGWPHLSSGAVRSGHVANEAVNSGNIGSGCIGSVHIQDGTIITVDVGSGAIQSGQISSGVIGRFHVASGQFAGFELGSGAIVSGRVASGQIGFGHLANASVQSGTVASGVLVSFARQIVEEFNTEEAISGLKAVFLSSGGFIGLANAASGLRLPAVGVVPANYVSGDLAGIVTMGKITTPMCSGWSGFVGKHLYCGSGGQIVGKSGLLSGMAWQKIGVAFSGGIYVNIDLTILSGGYTVGIGGNTEVF